MSMNPILHLDLDSVLSGGARFLGKGHSHIVCKLCTFDVKVLGVEVKVEQVLITGPAWLGHIAGGA